MNIIFLALCFLIACSTSNILLHHFRFPVSSFGDFLEPSAKPTTLIWNFMLLHRQGSIHKWYQLRGGGIGIRNMNLGYFSRFKFSDKRKKWGGIGDRLWADVVYGYLQTLYSCLKLPKSFYGASLAWNLLTRVPTILKSFGFIIELKLLIP